MKERLIEKFQIMKSERVVATITSNGLCKLLEPNLLPYNLWLESCNDFDTRLNNISNFNYWCSSRMLTLDRKYAKEILNSIKEKQTSVDSERSKIVISYHGLTLTDDYWIKNEKEDLLYKDINLYEHSLSDSFVDVSLRGKQLTVENSELVSKNDISSNLFTLGVAPKAWIKRDGEFYLLKDGDNKEVEAEILASQITRCFNINQVIYEKDTYLGLSVSKCKLITTLDHGIVPIEFVDVYLKNKEIDTESFVIEKDPYNYFMMNIIDYLVGNTDRHWGNWGFWVNNKTNELTKLYPLMDFNKAFNCYDNIDGAICQTTKNKMSQKDAAIIAVKKIGLNQIKEVSKDIFPEIKMFEMFNKRLKILKEI